MAVRGGGMGREESVDMIKRKGGCLVRDALGTLFCSSNYSRISMKSEEPFKPKKLKNQIKLRTEFLV